MKKMFLKQASFWVIGLALTVMCTGEVLAGGTGSLVNTKGATSLIQNAAKSKIGDSYNANFVMDKVKGYSGGFNHTQKDWEDLLEWTKDSKYSKEFSRLKQVGHGDMYRQISKNIEGLKNTSLDDIRNSFTKDVEDLGDDITEGTEGMMDTFSADAWSAALDAVQDDMRFTSDELGITYEAKSMLLNAKNYVSEEGPGVPTLDLGNIGIGIYNVDSVIETFHYDEDIRDYDTRACAEMGVSGLTGGNASTGEFCCLLWEESSEGVGMNALMGAVGGLVGGGGLDGAMVGGADGALEALDALRLAAKRKRAGYDYCCRLSDDPNEKEEYVFCKAKSAQKAECLNGELDKGTDVADAWKACDIECGGKDYGELSYNEDGKYDPKDVDKLMKECYKTENKWSPSTTVPTSSELAPVIPNFVKEDVTK